MAGRNKMTPSAKKMAVDKKVNKMMAETAAAMQSKKKAAAVSKKAKATPKPALGQKPKRGNIVQAIKARKDIALKY
jgi:hypothetical protein